MGKCLKVCGLGAALAAIAFYLVFTSVWWYSFDPMNGADFWPVIDWSTVRIQPTTAKQVSQFREEGALQLKAYFNPDFVRSLDPEIASIEATRTFINDVYRPNVLPFYGYYGHYVHTVNPVLYDWATRGPFAELAQRLIGSDTVRLYNVELIVRSVEGCKEQWHRDSLAAPSAEARTAIINVYLQDIDDKSDGLIFCRGSHKDTETSERSYDMRSDVIRHNVTVGDIVIHNGDVLHTTSGVGCFPRKSLQFRYIDGGATFAFDGYRIPSVWSWVHLGGWVGHGLSNGDPLTGSWYPQVFPPSSPDLEPTNRPITMGSFWAIVEAFTGLSKRLPTVDQLADMSKDQQEQIMQELKGFGGFEGFIKHPELWHLQPETGLPFLKK